MMFNLILFASVMWNSIFTVLIALFMVFIFYIETKWIQKREGTIKKGLVIIMYIISFLLLIFGLFGILIIWNFDLLSYATSMMDQFAIFITDSIGKLISTALILFFSTLILKVSKVAFKHISTRAGTVQRRKQTMTKVMSSIVRYVVGILAFLVVLSIWGVNVLPALAGLGILGLVVGLGAQKFINDLISGFFIVFEHHFDVGDIIEVQGFKGAVIDIGLKTTKIKNWKGEVKILSNGEISNLINYSRDLSTAIVDFGIAYKEDIQETIDLLTNELPKMKARYKEIFEGPTVLGVMDLSSSSIIIRVTAKTLNEQHYAVERELRKIIKEILDEHEIEIPFPQIVMHQPK